MNKLKKRLIASLAVLAVCVTVTGGAMMIGLGETAAPYVPDTTKDTTGDSSCASSGEGVSDTTAKTEAESTEPATTETDEIEAPTTEVPTTESAETAPPWTEPIWTEQPWTEPYETVPIQTDPPETTAVQTEPAVTEPVRTGPVPFGSLQSSVWYPETEDTPQTEPATEETKQTDESDVQYDGVQDSPTVSFPSSDKSSIDPSSYVLGFIERAHTFDDKECFYVGSDDIPSPFPVYVPDMNGYDENYVSHVKKLIEMLYGAREAEGFINGGYSAKDGYDTYICANTVGWKGASESFNTVKPLITLSKTALDGATEITADGVQSYVKSLPHFKAMCSYANIESCVAERNVFSYSGIDVYEFVFIPETDSVVEAAFYKCSKYVRAYVRIKWTESGPDSTIELSATNFPCVIGEYVDAVGYAEAYERVMSTAEKYGVREYFEDNIICRLTHVGENMFRPYYRFYVAFTDDDGNVAYYEPEECGLDENGRAIQYTPFGHISFFKH